MPDYFERQFTSSEIWNYQTARMDKDKVLKTNHLKYSFKSRWVGDAGEDTFKTWLTDERGMIENIDFTHLTNDRKADLRDFDVVSQKLKRAIRVDVKTTARNIDPNGTLNCVVVASQKEHIQRNADVLVFCTYHNKKAVCSLLGWLTVSEFFAHAKFIAEGESLGGTNANAHVYSVYVSDLRPFSELKVED